MLVNCERNILQRVSPPRGKKYNSLFVDDMTFYTENPKGSTQKPLELINSGKPQDTKSAYRNLLCFYPQIMNDESEKLGKESHCHCIRKNKGRRSQCNRGREENLCAEHFGADGKHQRRRRHTEREATPPTRGARAVGTSAPPPRSTDLTQPLLKVQ